VVQRQLIKARPTINVPAHRVKRDLASQPIVLKSLLVDDHNPALAIVRARVEVRLRHNWMTSWEINRATGRAIARVWRATRGPEPALGRELAIVAQVLANRIAPGLQIIARTSEIEIVRTSTIDKSDRATSTSAMSTLATRLTTRRTGKRGWTIGTSPRTGFV
jgi:hypothetical protein